MSKMTLSISTKYTIKAIITAAMILAFLIPMAIILNLVEERKQRQYEAVENIAQSYAKPQILAGPYLLIPTTKIVQRDKGTVALSEYKILLPKELNIEGKLNTAHKKRGIYEVPIYNTDFTARGAFDLKEIKPATNETINWQDAKIAYSISDARGFNSSQTIKVNGQTYALDNNLPAEYSILNSTAFAPMVVDPNLAQLTFELPIKIKGSESIKFAALGRNTKIKINSSWKDPSFDGNFLPEHNITPNGFDATWSIGNINRSFPQVWHNAKYTLAEEAFGVRLYQVNNHYINTERSVKYAILFIGLTFGFFFLLEVMQGRRVHPVQYILVGLALIIFYTLLLSFGEYTGFKVAYIIATLATVGLITYYCKHLFRKWSNALMIGLFLLALYTFIYIIIQMQEYNLIAGSVGLFVLIATAMYFSRKIDWYKEVYPSLPPVNSEPNNVSTEDVEKL